MMANVRAPTHERPAAAGMSFVWRCRQLVAISPDKVQVDPRFVQPDSNPLPRRGQNCGIEGGGTRGAAGRMADIPRIPRLFRHVAEKPPLRWVIRHGPLP